MYQFDQFAIDLFVGFLVHFLVEHRFQELLDGADAGAVHRVGLFDDGVQDHIFELGFVSDVLVAQNRRTHLVALSPFV